MERRTEKLTDYTHSKNVLYLMQRDQRIHKNYSFLLSQNLSTYTKTKLYVATNPSKIKSNDNQRAFIFEGLTELSTDCANLNIPFYLLNDIEEIIKAKDIDCIVTEFSPLREHYNYHGEIKEICERYKMCFIICDSHNIVPCKNINVYVKGPRGVRIRLFKFWDMYFKKFEKIECNMYNDMEEVEKTRYIFKEQEIRKDKENSNDKSKDKSYDSFGNEKKSFFFCTINEYDSSDLINKTNFKGGLKAGLKELDNFIKIKLCKYKKLRNNPAVDCLSNLSPWIHTGQLGTQGIIQRCMKHFKASDENLETFISEIFVWKEIAEHFCLHEKNYDNMNGALPWAKETLTKHTVDKREKIYTLEQLESASTTDDEWNAGQKQMVIQGKMHGYVRMYWAKKMLMWTKTPREALEYGIYLNDKYSIDGNDPNGYLGVMWSVCGAMDQGWGEKEVFGKIRSMKGVKSDAYVLQWKNKKI